MLRVRLFKIFKMARTVAVIQQQIIDAKNAEPELTVFNSTSKRAIWLLWTYVMAVCIAIFEQVMDIYVATIEALVAKNPAGSTLWVQSKMFEFQYSATTPQVIQLVNNIPVYPVINDSLKIITACSVKSDIANRVNIKLAKNNPFEALDANELAASQAYIDIIGVAGIRYVAISLSPDKLYIDADIYYQGQFSAVIQQLVIDALNAYLQTLSVVNFDGTLKMSDLEQVIRNVNGVNDVVLSEVRGRADSVPFALGFVMIQNKTVLQRMFNPVAGYMVQETTTGNTFADTLNFIAS